MFQKRQEELKQSLDLASYLLAPIQRITKYKLMLENIKKELKKIGITSDILENAINIIQKELITGNDYIAIDSISKWPQMQKTELGSFIMRDMFTIKYKKKYESMVFLFERMIIFTIPVSYFDFKYLNINFISFRCFQESSEKFIFRSAIRLCDMGIVIFENDPFIFHLRVFMPNKRKAQVTYILEAKSNKTKILWTEYIYDILFRQLQEGNDYLSNVFQTQLLWLNLVLF